MNKAQINYFCESMNIYTRRAIDELKAKYPVIQDLSTEEKVGLITSGQARFKEELFSGEQCPHFHNLGMIFEFPGEEERRGKVALRQRLLTTIEARIKEKARRLKEDFVMKEIEDPRAALRTFAAEQHETDGERAQLLALYGECESEAAAA